MGPEEMTIIADLINRVLSDIESDTTIKEVKNQVQELCHGFPLYKNIK